MSAPSPVEDNAFLVLGVATNASPIEIERAVQKLMAQLALGIVSASTYHTPLGPRVRDETKIREAAMVLRAPETRVLHELWAPTEQTVVAFAKPENWAEAMQSIHWSWPCPP